MTMPPSNRTPEQARRIDAEVAVRLQAEAAAAKLAKARARIALMKAKQRGDLKRMPLSGRAAWAAIRGD